MTDSKHNKRGKTPTHIAYHVRENGDNSFWTRIGSAWLHEDGQGFNVQVETVPLNGRIVLRIQADKKD